MGWAGILLAGLFVEIKDMGLPSGREEGGVVLDWAMTSVDINSNIKVVKILNVLKSAISRQARANKFSPVFCLNKIVRIKYSWFEVCNLAAKLFLLFQKQQKNQDLFLHDFYTIFA